MKQLDTTEHLFLPHVAEEIAAELQAEDDDWTYTVVHDPSGRGFSYIAIYEDGVFVAKY